MITIKTKLPDYCKSTNNPRFEVVEVLTPSQWLPTYEEISTILMALSNCENQNRKRGQQQFNENEKDGDTRGTNKNQNDDSKIREGVGKPTSKNL